MTISPRYFMILILLTSQGEAQYTPKNQQPIQHSKENEHFAPIDRRCPKDQKWTDANLEKWLHLSGKRLHQLKVVRALDNQALCTLPAKTLARALSKVENPPRPDKPDAAMQFRMEQLSVNGVVRPDGLINAMKQLDRIESFTQQFIQKQAKTISVSRDNWVPLGPGNIGGRIRTLWVHPKDPNLLFAGSVGGGIWKSTDGGANWHAVDDFMASLAVTSIVADPRTTDDIATTVLYAATGEGVYNIDALRGYGLFKSVDGGETWQHLPSTDPTTEDSDWYYVNRIAINHDGVMIAVARSNAVFTSSDDGDTWSKSEPGPNWYTVMEDVKFDPNDDSKAIVGSVNGNCYYTTDTGTTWTESNIVDASDSWLSGRVELSYAASTANKIYASVDNNNGEIYRSDDGGVTWELVDTPEHLGNQGWYANAIWVDPTDDAHLVIGGLDLYQTTDAGDNWTKISTWWLSPNSPHADHHAIVSDPGYNGDSDKRVYITNDGGLYKADDITATDDSDDTDNGWENINNGLAVTQFYGAAALTGSRITGGTQDNGTLLNIDINNSSWDKVFGGDGGFSATSTQVTDGEYYYFGEYVYLQIHRSDNGAGSSYIYENGLDDAGDNANFIAPFVMDPNDNNTMLAGGESLWRSTNVSTEDENDINWTKIKDPVDGTKISQIAIAEGDSDLILVGYNNGSIYKTTNGTAVSPTWTQIHDDVSKHVLALLIDKDDHDILYAGWGGFDSDNLQKSDDGGNSWNTISDALPDVPMRTIERHPTRSDYLYVGTDVGLFTSEDQGGTWLTVDKGPANVSVEKLFWYDVVHGLR